jgi:subtilisin family serine protease
VVYSVSAGNSSANACNYSPARVGAAITVGATTSTDARASYSNTGTCLDIFAPGSSITSAWKNSNTAKKTISGTSMASPHVAGVAALYLQNHPGSSPAAVRNAIVGAASTGKVTNPGSGSPNLLLYSLVP